MEIPQDYNIQDSFYQNKLLQSIGIHNTSPQPYKDIETEDTKS